MKNYRCGNCGRFFELDALTVKTTWFLNEKHHWKNTGYNAKCPFCGRRDSITFCELPLKLKISFIKDWLGGQ